MDKKQWAVEQLREKHEEIGRLPQRKDFDNLTMCRIKGILGPWPRALEAAGLKPPKDKTKNSAKSHHNKAANPYKEEQQP